MKRNACSLRVHVNAVSMGVGDGVLKNPFCGKVWIFNGTTKFSL